MFFVHPPRSSSARVLTFPRPPPPAASRRPDIQREEKAVQKSIKDCAKRNDLRSMKLLAKEVVHSRKTVARLFQNKAQMNSVSMMLGEQLATVKSVGHLTTSTEVLRLMNGLVKNEKVRDTMREMSKEMMRGGLIEEMVNDAFEEMESDDLEAETETEVTAVLAELAGEQMAAMPGAETHPVAMPERAKEKAAVEQEGEEDVEIDALQARLDAIRQEAS
jgi:charged multivesicular body protein 3